MKWKVNPKVVSYFETLAAWIILMVFVTTLLVLLVTGLAILFAFVVLWCWWVMELARGMWAGIWGA